MSDESESAVIIALRGKNEALEQLIEAIKAQNAVLKEHCHPRIHPAYDVLWWALIFAQGFLIGAWVSR